MEPTESNHFDVLIVGAGLSGIGAGFHLQRKCPGKSFVILEGRDCIGGTWDLFRYPGIRSDSDMFTLGYSFKPWTEPKAIADGPRILNYVRETAIENGIDKKIRFRHRVKRASWSTSDARWTVEAERMVGEGAQGTAIEIVRFTCNFMLQRSPTYVVSRPAQDPLANKLRRNLPTRLAYHLIRWRNVLFGMYFFQLSRRKPAQVKNLILGGVRMALGPDYDIATHFTPRYNPWDQRLCLVPDGDLFKAIRDKRASVATCEIDRFTKDGIRLKDGSELEADIIITATGLVLQVLGGLDISVDGRPVDFATTLNYKGMMYSDVPNLASAFGYTNASWTLKCDLTCEYVCRLINYMDRHGYKQCVPHNCDPTIEPMPSLNFTSGYVQRSIAKMPKQGSKRPWRLYQNYALDIVSLRFGKVDDGVMRYS